MILHLNICWAKDMKMELITIKGNANAANEAIIVSETKTVVKGQRRKYHFNSYFVCVLVTTLKHSESYRAAVLRNLFKLCNLELDGGVPLVLRVQMFYPSRHIIDHNSSHILNHLSHEKRELDSAMAWLSTLGGAFSALGDHFQHCAVMAGKISVQQFKLALKLGDPQTVSKCKLFFSLSLIQRGHLKMARDIIKKEYENAVHNFPHDKRLQRMCCGIWSKLQFEWRIKYKKKNAND